MKYLGWFLWVLTLISWFIHFKAWQIEREINTKSFKINESKIPYIECRYLGKYNSPVMFIVSGIATPAENYGTTVMQSRGLTTQEVSYISNYFWNRKE